ncbi:MAG TPA: V-type ATPase 116kDa subunit family protein [Acidimicrobiales bacterium]|nr:V-type ATPase 116kDa subunit family protein [Acidimicrobiales bacterium]
MPWREVLEPARMDRVAVVAPSDGLRRVLVAVADAGVVELERLTEPVPGPAGAALERCRSARAATATRPVEPEAVLLADAPDAGALERAGRLAELAGEAELEQVAAAAVRRGAVAALTGWSPASAVGGLADRLAALGGALVRLPPPRGASPPTLVESGGATGAFQPLVDTYTTLPYADINPSAFAGLAYVVMFGMMFGDVGHGALLTLAGVLLARGRPRSLSHLRRLAPFVIGAGLASMLFGLAFGEAFGPTGAVPTLWLAPLDHPTTLLAVAVAAGAGLLALAYTLGTVNRWRESGAARALLAASGLAGALLYLGLAVVGLGWYRHVTVALVTGGVLAATGFTLGFVGSYAGSGAGGGRAAQAAVEAFDAVVRIGTNTVSFARLAAFGLTHAALGGVVWAGTAALWHRGAALWLPAALVFLVGNGLAFALEGLVAGVQALRLEYYELFSRIFVTEGHRFRPWHVPTLTPTEEPCSPG